VRPGSLARSISRRAEAFWRRHPREATCLTLMALVGLAYPFPFWWLDFAIWLAAAGVALSSQLWDHRDKWTGLAGPVVLVVVGTAMGLVLGGTHTRMSAYVHETLAGSLYLIKAGSLGGAGYLAWRVRRGRRNPPVPPWRRQRRT
jgi:hypothetical protein